MPWTLGKPGCVKCKGDGVYPGPDHEVIGQQGQTIKYPTVIRCSCLEKSSESSSSDRPDAQRRAAGEKE